MATKPGPNKDKVLTKHRLTAQHELFVDALVCRNMTTKDAAIAAGVPAKSASSMGSQWLNVDKYPQITARVQALKEKLRNTSEVDAKRLIQELARIALFNPKMLLKPDGKGMIDLKDMPDEVAAVVQNISVSYGEEQDGDGNFHRVKYMRFTFHDKLGAISQLANMLGLNNGGTTIINNNNNSIVVKWDELYQKSKEMAAQKRDPIEEEIAELEARAALPPKQESLDKTLSPEEKELIHKAMEPPTATPLSPTNKPTLET